MTRKEFDDIKPRLLDILRDVSPVPPRELLDELVKYGELPDSEARNAIWRLIDDGDIRLSLDRRFEVTVPQR